MCVYVRVHEGVCVCGCVGMCVCMLGCVCLRMGVYVYV